MRPKLLYEAYENDFLIGAAVSRKNLKNYHTLLKNFNSITPENELKFENIHPARDNFNFDDFDKMVSYAKENEKVVRGHTLIWHNQIPKWLVEEKNLDRQNLLKDMEMHISTIMDRYRNSVYCWDVVNEAITDENDGIFRDTFWKRYIGNDFIDRAFFFAHEAVPKAQLYLNEYNLEIENKADKLIEVIKNLKKNHVPIHGVGIQGHYSIYFPKIKMIQNMFEVFSKLDLMLQITELDVSMFRFEDRRKDLKTPTNEMIENQKRYYNKLFKLFREYKDLISGITFWGVADDYTWLDDYPVQGRKNWPLLFDIRHQPKAIFNELISRS